MSHECPECGMQCDCDGEDHDQPAPDDCACGCSDDESDCCALCGVYLDGEMHQREPNTNICTHCAEDVDDGPYVREERPDEFDDDEHHDFDDQVIT